MNRRRRRRIVRETIEWTVTALFLSVITVAVYSFLVHFIF